MTTTAPEGTWVEVDDPELAKDDVPVSQDVSTRRVLALQLTVFLALAMVGLALTVFDFDDGPDKVLQTGAKLASAAVALSLIDRLGWYRRVGFCTPRKWGRLWLAWLPAVYVAIAFAAGGGDQTFLAVVGIAGFALAIGLEEELWTRGLLLETLRWRGTTAAVVLSALWFGALHSLNLLSGQPTSSTVAQIGLATAFGLAVGAVRVRCGTLWLPIALHALYNLGPLLRADELANQTGIQAAPAAGVSGRELVGFLILVTPLALYGLFLARPSKVPGPDGRMPRRRVKVEPWAWPQPEAGDRPEAANVLGRWPTPPPHLIDQWYRRKR